MAKPFSERDLLARVANLIAARRSWQEAEPARQELERSVAQLEHERDLREKFVAALTHDLRTPLAAAKMGAELLALETPDPVLLKDITGRIVANMDRADHMIRDLLDATRIKAGERLPLTLEECGLNEIANAALADLASVHGDRFILQVDRDVSGLWDRDSLRRMIDNLVGNAVKYGTPSTPITLRIRDRGDSVDVSVHNFGNPIPAEDQGSLFQLFKRSKSATQGGQKGWGIGLTLVQGLVEAHGGSSSVSSSADEGTVFNISLPRDARPLLLLKGMN